MSNPPLRSRVQSVVEVPKYDCRNELDERKQNQLHRLNRRCAIGASDGCRIDRRPNIGVSLGARWNQVKTALMHWFNRWIRNRHRCNRHTIVQRRCQVRSSQAFSTGRTDAPSVLCISAMTSAEKDQVQRLREDQVSLEEPMPYHRFNRWSLKLLQLCQRSQQLFLSSV